MPQLMAIAVLPAIGFWGCDGWMKMQLGGSRRNAMRKQKVGWNCVGIGDADSARGYSWLRC
jgi:hypothetical protein